MAAGVNCFECVHYHVTWDAAFPRGCRAMAFKGREMPSAVVLQSSGSECRMFEPKPGARKAGGEQSGAERA